VPQQSGGLFDLDFSGGNSSTPGPGIAPSGANAALQAFDFPSNGQTPPAQQSPVDAASAADPFSALQGNLGNLFNAPQQQPCGYGPNNVANPFAEIQMPMQNGQGQMPMPNGQGQMPMPNGLGQMPMPNGMPGMPGMPTNGMAGMPAVPMAYTGAPANAQFPQMGGFGQQLGHMNNEQLLAMQAMISQQLQAQVQAPGMAPGVPTAGQFQANPFGGAAPAKERQFGDLLAGLGDNTQTVPAPTAKPAGGSPFDMFG
jgi:hypothetical protein